MALGKWNLVNVKHQLTKLPIAVCYNNKQNSVLYVTFASVHCVVYKCISGY